MFFRTLRLTPWLRAALRSFVGGKLRTSAGDLLPFNTQGLPNANDAHIFADSQLFLAGDVRANENIELASLQTLFMREQLQKLFMESGTTMVLVSHDLEEAVYLADRVLLLSRHPAHVADFTRVAAARPRTDATLSDADFVRTKAHCLEIFQREVRRA